MNGFEAISGRRSIRRFHREKIDVDILKQLVKFGSMAASGMNIQPLKYIITKEDTSSAIFPYTKWAGYLKGKGSPTFEERPPAFILVLNDLNLKKSNYELDAGAAVENILIAAHAMGLAGCWLGAIDFDRISEIAQIDGRYKLISAIAIGYPAQKSIAECADGDIKYYLDEDEVLHVPKRDLDEIILNIF